MITVDIKTTLVSERKRVWRFFPGNGYKFVGRFEQGGRIFLDIPGFEFPKGGLEKDPQLLARILLAQKTGDLLREQGTKANISLRLSEFEHERRSPNRGRLVNTVVRLFTQVNKGDLVIVPKQLESGNVLIGEVTSRRGTHVNTTFKQEYGLTPIPAKRIRWIETVPENKLSTSLSRALRHEHTLSELTGDLASEILSIAYTNYAKSSECSATLFNLSDFFLDRDSSIIGLISQIAAIHVYRATEWSVESAFSESYVPDPVPSDLRSNPFSALLYPAPLAFNCSQAIDIHSAGFNRYLSENVTPIVTASIFSILSFLGATSTTQSIEADIQKIKFVNSKSLTHDSCTPTVSDATKSFFETTDADKIWQMCRLAREVRERSDLQTGVTVSDKNHSDAGLPEKRYSK